MCRPARDIEEGYRLGQVGLAMHEEFKIKVWFPRLAITYYLGVYSFKHPLPTILEPMQQAMRIGIETGDLESAMACGVVRCFVQIEFRPLAESEANYQSLREQVKVYNQQTAYEVTKPNLQLVQNLMGRGSLRPSILCGEIIPEHELALLQEPGGPLFNFVHGCTMMLGYLFGDLEQATRSSKALRFVLDNPFSGFDASLIVFLDGMVAVRNARRPKNRKNLRHAQKQVKRMCHWAQHSPHTFLCRQFLLEAELAVTTGDQISVHSKYVAAIGAANHSGSIFISALGNELAGKYYMFVRNDEGTALPFLREAFRLYESWGAKAKVEHLSKEVKLC